MSADQYSERTLGKKLEWGALIGDHHQHAGGRLDGRTFQLEAGASLLETEFGNPDGGIAVCTAADGAPPAHQRTSPAVAVDTPPSSAHPNSYYQRPRQRQLGAPAVSPAPSDASNINIKRIVPRQSSSAGLSVGKGVIEWTAGTAGRGGTAGVSLTVRATGTKDRHSKVKTAKGLRDRRVRLSAPTAIQFFDVQDRLGYDQPSKAVDWLIKKARPAIDELAQLEGVVVGDGGAAAAHRDAEKKMGESRDRTDLDDPSITVKEEEQRSSGGGVVGTLGGARAESRAKARERARQRAKEKSGTETPASTSVAPAPTPPASAPPAPSYPSSPNLQLLPEILFLSQLRQHNSQPALFDQHHHHLQLRPLQPSDFSSSFAILQQPTSIATPAGNSATHLLPYASHLFHMAAPPPPPPTSAASFLFHDVPPLHFSAPPIYNTPISPRGTLQSIFSNSVSSVPQVPMPPHVMGLQGYGAAPGPSGYGVEGGGFHGTADVVAAGLHQNSGFPLRIHGMELDPHEETRMPPSSMADFQ